MSERVREYIVSKKIDASIVELSRSTSSSRLAAEALGCSIAQIAKSIVFCGERNVVVVISGDKKVDMKKLESVVGGKLRVAGLDEVYEITGYRAGGVPPFPHKEGIKVILDSSIKRFSEIWASAGTPNSVMRLKTMHLISLLGNTYEVAEER